MISKGIKWFVLVCLVSLVCCMSVYATGVDDIVLTNSSGQVWVLNGTNLATIATCNSLGNLTAVGVQKGGNIVVGNTAGDTYLRNAFNLAAVTQNDMEGTIRDLAVQSDDDILVACDDLAGGTVRLRANYSLVYIADHVSLGTVTAVTVMKGSDRGTDVTDRVAVGNAAGYIYYLNKTDLSTYSWGSDWGYVRAMAGTPYGNVAIGTDAGLFLRCGSTLADGVAALYGIFGTIADVASDPYGHIAVGGSANGGAVWVRRNTDLDGKAYNPGFGTITAVATQSDGDIVVGRSDGYIFILDGSNASLPAKAYLSGFGSITDVAVTNYPASVANNETFTAVTSTTKVGSTVYMNGSPFLPRILYGAKPNQVFKNQGFNIAHLQCGTYTSVTDAVNDIKAFLDTCQANGMWGIVNFGGSGFFLSGGNFYETGIINTINTNTGSGLLKDHPALFCYEVADEPNAPGDHYASAYACQSVANGLHATDPDHLVWVNLGAVGIPSDYYDDYLTSQDVWSFDCYPLGVVALTESVIKKAFDVFTSLTDNNPSLRGTRPLGTFLQGYKIPDGGGWTYRVPTPAELRAQAYGFLIHDYRWFGTYAWDDISNDPTLHDMPQLWDCMRTINSEMLTLKSVILDGGFFTSSGITIDGTKAPSGAALVSRDIDARKKTVAGTTYLIAVNGLGVTYGSGVSANVNIRGLSGFTWAERMFETTGNVTISGGTLTDSFGPYGVHVYKLH